MESLLGTFSIIHTASSKHAKHRVPSQTSIRLQQDRLRGEDILGAETIHSSDCGSSGNNRCYRGDWCYPGQCIGTWSKTGRWAAVLLMNTLMIGRLSQDKAKQKDTTDTPNRTHFHVHKLSSVNFLPVILCIDIMCLHCDAECEWKATLLMVGK